MKSARNILLALAVLAFVGAAPDLRAQVEYVDPTIGGVGILLNPTRPTVHLPNSTVRMYPMRNDQLDDQIRFFPLTIISHRLGELFSLMPGATAAPAAWDQEITTPYYYSTRFDESLIRTEFTPTERCGYFRFTFPNGQATVHLANLFSGDLRPEGSAAASGEERFTNMKAYFYGEFSAPANITTNGTDKKLLVAQAGGQTLEFRYGISFISVEQAKTNLQKEIPAWGFENTKTAARQRWNDVLGRVTVEGGTDAQRRVFYTSLYRSYERMINITEDGRYYSAFDHAVHADTQPFYVDNWIWDTFHALQPLQVLLNPSMQGDQLQSYVRAYQQSGWMPSFGVLWGDFACMIGNHAASWFADAWFKGLRNFDMATAYQGLRKNSLEATLIPWRNGSKTTLDNLYPSLGYFPSLGAGETETEPLVDSFEKRQAVSVTLDMSYDDWCIAQLANVLTNSADRALFTNRAGFYQNVWNASTGFMSPKDSAGRWVSFDPKFGGGQGGRAYFAENNAYTYNWDVLHDFSGLFGLMGGNAAAEAKLDNLFREGLGRSKYDYWVKFPDSTGLVGQFVMANEPSLSTPYLYNRVGAPWKTQKRIRTLLQAHFTDEFQGIPGDEDGGALTAWVVFSMMGFYPVTPGVPIYDLGSPVFSRVTIRLENGKFLDLIANNNSADNKYIQSVTINGRAVNQVWFRHSDIANGGTIQLQMGNTPNRSIGSAPESLPPSSAAVDPQILATQDVPLEALFYANRSLTLSGSVPGATAYQWQSNGVNLVSGGRVFGASSNALTISNLQLNDAATYRLQASTNGGTGFNTPVNVYVTAAPDFRTNGLGWAFVNAGGGGSYFSSPNVLSLTSGYNQRRAAWFTTKMNISAFQASFLYQDLGGGGADGVAFVMQNSPDGTNALGTVGGGMAYNTITASAAVKLNVYTASSLAFTTGGANGTFVSTAPVNLAGGDPIQVDLAYSNSTLRISLSNTLSGATFTTNVNSLNLPGVIGTNLAYVGITAATGGLFANQQVSNFRFVPIPTLTITTNSGSILLLTWPATIGGYQVQAAPELAPTSWSTVPGLIDQTNGTLYRVVPQSSSSYFYRLSLP